MNKFFVKILYVLAAFVIVSGVYFVFNRFRSKNVDSGNANQNIPVTSNIPVSKKYFTGKYVNKEFGVGMDIPTGLILESLPNEQIGSGSDFPGNPKPDLTLMVSSNPDGGDAQLFYFNGRIAIYKQHLDPKKLLGNHSAFNEEPGAPKHVFGYGPIQIAGIKYQKYDFVSNTMNGIHLYELAGNLDNGWTVYAWSQFADHPQALIKDDNQNLSLLKKMIQSIQTF